MKDYKGKHENANKIVSTAKNILKVIGIILIAIIIVAVFGFVVKSLWNWLMPEIFNLRRINYWQGIGLIILFKIFFGGVSASSSKSEVNKDDIVRDSIRKEKYKYTDFDEDKGHKESAKVNNSEQEKLYEDWWMEEGEAKFNEYLSKINASFRDENE